MVTKYHIGLFFLPGGLRSSSWSFLILLLLSGRLNLLESVLFDIVELFELLELDELEFPFTVLVASLSNLTSHFFAAVWQTTPPPVKKECIFRLFIYFKTIFQIQNN